MSHSQRCISANRFGDGFDCICDEEPLAKTQAELRPWHVGDPNHLTYHVAWSDDDRQFVGTCPLFPSLSWLDFSQISALEGIVSLVRKSLDDTARERPEAPISASGADTKPAGTDWHKLADERSAEIIRLGSLLDDAVAIIARWARPDDSWLDEQGRAFLADPTITAIVGRLIGAGWKGPKLLCPACGADYAEAEAKGKRLRAVFEPVGQEHQSAIRPRFAELELVRLKADVPGGGGWTEDMPVPAGSIGTIVHVHNRTAYEVEFTDDDGKTLRVATLTADALEKVMA